LDIVKDLEDKDRRIAELEAKIKILASENSRLAECQADGLLLGAIAELINSVNEIGVVLKYSLERISLLKGVPFCAYGVRPADDIILKEYFFSSSSEKIENKSIPLPPQLPSNKDRVFYSCDKEWQDLGLQLKFGPTVFSPAAVLLITSNSKLNPGHFMFAVSDASAGPSLKNMTSLLERLSDMIAARIDNLILLNSLRELNQELDHKVLIGIQELSVANQELCKEIEDRKQAEQELMAERERLAVTLRSIGDGVISTDTSGKILLMNKIAEELTGWQQDEAYGRSLTDVFHIIHEHSRKRCVNPVEKVLESGTITALESHTTLITKDGSEKIIADSGAPIRDKTNKIIGVVLVFRDVTISRKMEQEVLKIKKLESVGILAGGIAHDFNNILAAILGNISLSLMYINTDDKIYNLLWEAEKATLRAKNLTQQLLTFSRGGEPVKKIASITEVIKDSSDFVLRGSNIRCEYQFVEDLWSVEIDSGQISQVIQNIIMNAIHAMPTGGLIKISCENFNNDRDQVVTLHRGAYVKLAIQDQGFGIKAELLDKIFDPYFTTRQDGSGLGLAITHAIISKHSGHIEVSSKPGIGTRFTIFLPATQKQLIQPAVNTDELAQIKKGHGRIIIMDDEEMLRIIVIQMLARIGYEVIPARDGAEAIEIFKSAQGSSTPIDLIIMDLTVPGGMGGKGRLKRCLPLTLGPEPL